MLRENFGILITAAKDEVLRHYGDRLVSLAVFGSAASGNLTPDSDLDLFICARKLPRGRRARLMEFLNIEDRLGATLARLQAAGIFPSLSPVIKTPEETQLGSLIFIDMTESVEILHDPDNFLRNYLADLKAKLSALGSKKIKLGSAWFWDLVPNYKTIRGVSI